MHIQASPPHSDTAKISVKIKPIASSLLGADAPGNGKPTAKKPTLLASYATAKEALTAKFAERIADVEMPEEARCTPLPCYSTLPYATSP